MSRKQIEKDRRALKMGIKRFEALIDGDLTEAVTDIWAGKYDANNYTELFDELTEIGEGLQNQPSQTVRGLGKNLIAMRNKLQKLKVPVIGIEIYRLQQNIIRIEQGRKKLKV